MKLDSCLTEIAEASYFCNNNGETNFDVKFANNKKVKEKNVSLDPESIL